MRSRTKLLTSDTSAVHPDGSLHLRPPTKEEILAWPLAAFLLTNLLRSVDRATTCCARWSVLALTFQDGQSIRIISNASDGRDDGTTTKIDHPYRPARRSIWRLSRPTGDDREASVGSHRGPFGATRKHRAVGLGRATDRNASHLGARMVRERQAYVDDGDIVRSEIGHDDISTIGSPRDCEWPRLAIRIVSPYSDAGGLGAGQSLSSEIHIDDRNGVPFEIDFGALSGGDGDEAAIGARLDAERPGLNGNARRDFDDRNAHQGPLQIHH